MATLSNSGRLLSAICQHTRLATPNEAVCHLHPSVPTSWDDVGPSMVPAGSVWGPHSLHTAEVTGSKPVTRRRDLPVPG